jgi:AcrR family transcriptional regulator
MVYRRTARSDEVRARARTRILDAARALFARDGYEATTMQQIVARAGTSIGNAYFYFPNKEQLFAELIERCVAETWDETEALAEPTAPGAARVGTIIYANLLGMLVENRDLAYLLFLADRHGTGIRIVREMSIARWLPHLASSFPGRTDADYQLIATAIFGANRTAVERVLTGGLDAAPPRVARDMARWSLRALGADESEVEAAVRSAARRHAARAAAR